MSSKSTKKNPKKKTASVKQRYSAPPVKDFDEVHTLEEPKSLRLTFQLIVKRNLPNEAESWSHEQIVQELSTVSHLRLDRENIGHIDNLELLSSKLTNLYLQHNQIQRIENIDCLPNLRFLTLAANQLRTISGLCHLKHLGFLDLSENLIQTFDIDELPQSLIILNLKGNPCTHLSDYRGSIIQDLHNLKQLDGEQVTKLEKREVGFIVSSDSDEDGEDVSGDEEAEFQMEGPVTRSAVIEIFSSTASQILIRSQERLEEFHQEHMRKMELLDEIRADGDLPPSSARSNVSARSAKQSQKLLMTKKERSRHRHVGDLDTDSD